MLKKIWQKLVNPAEEEQPLAIAVASGDDAVQMMVARDVKRLHRNLETLFESQTVQSRQLGNMQLALDELAWNNTATFVREQIELLDAVRALETSAAEMVRSTPPRTWQGRLAEWLAPRGINPAAEQWAEATGLMRRRLERRLWERGVREVPGCDSPFDTETHVATQRVEGAPVDRVYQVLRPGYSLQGRVVRPAEVALGG